MNLLIALFLVSAMPATPVGVARTRLKMIVQVSELSNLVYQLDCLSGFSSCSESAYRHLWKSRLHWSDQDQSELEKWKLVRGKYHGSITLSQAEFQPTGLPWNGPTGLELDDKFAIATFNATDEQSLKTHWEVILAPMDLPKLEAIVGYFEPRFSSWWREQPQEEASRFQRELQNAVQNPDVQVLLGSFAKFYAADFPDQYPVYLNLFLRPQTEGNGSHATMVENHAVVEFVPGEATDRLLRVVTHELCHFLYSSSPDRQKQRLINAFSESQDPASLAGWGLLNEGLATALGNGIAGEHLLSSATYKKELQTERSFYNDAAIDAAAKALIPFLDIQLSHDRTLYDPDFVEGYLSSLKKGMPARFL